MSDDSTTRLVKRWQAGDDTSAQEFVDRYAQRLCSLAETEVGRKLRRRVNSDAIANSALRTFLRRLRQQQITIDGTGATWKLLATITRNKVKKLAESHQAQRRDVNREVNFDANDWNQRLSDGAMHEDIAALMDEVDRLIETLEPQDAQILTMQLAGDSLAEITAKTGISRWTVRRTLDRIGHQLQLRLRKS